MRTDWLIKTRNKLSNIAMECDSSSAKKSLSDKDRAYLQRMLRDTYAWIDRNA